MNKIEQFMQLFYEHLRKDEWGYIAPEDFEKETYEESKHDPEYMGNYPSLYKGVEEAFTKIGILNE